MTYAPSAPKEIWATQAIDAGTKISVMAMWSWADHAVQQDVASTTVYAKMLPGCTPTESLIARLTEQTGATPRAIREHLRKARAEGFAEISGLVVTLHWPPRPPAKRDSVSGRRDDVGAGHDNVNAIASADDAMTSEPDTITSTDDVAASDNDTVASSQLNPSAPHSPPIVPPSTPPDDVAVPPTRRRPKRAPATQRALPIPGADPPDTGPPPKPDDPPDNAALVAERLLSRQREVREFLGMAPPGKSTLDTSRRRKIEARIREHDLEACYRVIEVDAAECQAQGADGESWAYWNLDTPFRNAANFERRLDRWREDGDHVVWGVTRPGERIESRLRGAAAQGQDELLFQEGQRLAREERERLAGMQRAGGG